MKIIVRYCKPFAGVVLACLILLFGQAACDLSLPNLMSDMVNVGIQQSGIQSGAPEALRGDALKLLEFFMDSEEQAQMEESYNLIEPGSSEAQRLKEEYPLIQEESVAVLREDVTEEELDQLGQIYGEAGYGLLLYLQADDTAAQLQQAAATLAQSQGMGGMMGDSSTGTSYDAMNDAAGTQSGAGMEDPSTSTSYDAMNGAAGTQSGAGMEDPSTGTSYDAMNGAAGTQSGAGMEDPSTGTSYDAMNDAAGTQSDGTAQEGTSSLNETEEPTYGEESGSMDFSQGLEEADMEKLYQLLPLLSQVPQESLEEARSQAAGSDSMMGDQVGVTLTRLFYQELGMDINAIQNHYIWNKGLQMLGVALLGAAATVLVGFCSARMAAAIGRRMRRDLFAKVESFSSGEFDRFSTASLITRTTNDVQQIQMLITMGVRMMCYAPIMGIGGIIFAVGKSVSLSWLIAVAVVVLIGLIAVALALALPKFRSLQKLIDRLNLVSRENLSGMMVVRAFGNEAHEERRFDQANQDLAKTNRFVQRVMSGMMPGMTLVMNLLTVMIVWVGGHAIAESTLQVGDMMAFIQYAMQIIMAFLMIAVMFILVPRASVSAARIREVLDAPLTIRDPEQPEHLKDPKGLLEFKDVSFRYDQAESDVLEHISFTAKPGETTAIIGATGSGKSTLVNLIPRFYDVTQGQITLDGVDVRKLPQEELRQQIGYVPQKGMLFSGTVASNLRYGKEDAGEEELQKALEIAQASDFVGEMDEGMESSIAQGGTNVSGGQRQRLSIARALTRKAPLYIFDDSFSALDFKTDAALRKALAKDTAGATVILVAQRVSTIMHAQQILVLDQGRLVGKGTHKELLKTCPEYREIAESQLQKEELE